tara:strand:+ start:373 stop:873 length:501 start_codon:yes stop_codon:yes gene_type:complete
MNIYKLSWGIKLLEGLLIFKEGDRRIGEMKLSGILGNPFIANFKSAKYIIHPEVLSKGRFRIYNSSNEIQLALVKLKYWNSESQMEYQGREYRLKSNFLGVFGTYWTFKQERRYMSFSNDLLSGSVIESIPDEEMYHLFVLAAVQSMFIYSSLLLFTAILVIYFIL